MQPSILDLNFWHRSFLTTIVVNHYPLFEFPCDSGFCLHAPKLMQKNFHHDIMCSFMLYSFGTSTEASAPAVLSLKYAWVSIIFQPLGELHSTSIPVTNPRLPIPRVWEGQRQRQVGFSREAAGVLAVRGAFQMESGEYRLTRDLRLKQVHACIV